MRRLRSLLFFVLLFALLGAGGANADTFYFTFENDSGMSGQFGTLDVVAGTVSEEGAYKGWGSLTFTIDVDNANYLMGPAPDDHMFGFMLNYTGAVLDPASELLNHFPITLGTNGKVSGRNSLFDYTVDFGEGQPVYDPVSFRIVGVGLDMGDFLTAGVSTQNSKLDASFMLHVQNTGSNGTNSEAIGGVVPSPTSLVGLAGLGVMGLGMSIRRRRAV